MGSDIDASFVQRLSEAESLLDLISDQASLAKFNNQWLPLAGDLQAAINNEAVNTPTILIAYALSDRVSTVIQTFLDLDILSEKLMSSLLLEATSILSLEEPPLPVDVIQPTHPKSSSTPLPSSLPSYVQPAYIWLLDNLYNPYPSTLVRDQLARKTGSARKDIDAWFIDTRKKIGWNTLRRQNFSNKRNDIVAAATRFFSGNPADHDCLEPMDQATNVLFMNIETQAKELYSERFSESALALKLDLVVKNMTPEMKVRAKADERRRRSLVRNEKLERTRAASSYPSPNRSPSHSPEPSLPLSPVEDNLDLPSISPQSRKRRNSSLERHDFVDHRNQRPRTGTQSPEIKTGLLSPASSIHESLQGFDEDEITIPSLSINVPIILSSSKRKRRLSDAEDQGSHKRPHNFPIAPQPYAVSGPLPFSNKLHDIAQFDGWCYQNLDPIDHESGSAIAMPFEVELFDVSKFVSGSELSNFVEYPSPQIEDHTSHSPSRDSPDIQSFVLDMPNQPFDCDEMFSSDTYSRGFGLLDDIQSEDLSKFSHGVPPSLEVDFLPNFFNFYEAPTQSVHDLDRAQIADTATLVPTNPSSNPDWAFPTFISLPFTNSGDTFQDLSNTFPQGMDTFNPSILMSNIHSTEPPQSANRVSQYQTSAQDDRVAKQQKLFEIKEVARRLEAELAATTC